MIEANNVIETSEDCRLKSIKKWELICKTSNIILSVIYVLFGWIFGFLGIMFFSLGFSGEPFVAIFSFLSALLFLLTPAFCALGIFFICSLQEKEGFRSFVPDAVPSFWNIGLCFNFVFSFNYLKRIKI